MSHQSRRFLAAALALLGLGLVASAGTLVLSGHAANDHLRLRTGAQRERAVPAPAKAKEHRSTGAPRPKRVPIQIELPAPVRILVPAIGVSASIVPLDLNADETLQVPTSFSEAGWFTRGPEPGEPGPAVIVGHVDSVDGPGVFYHLRALRRDDLIKIVAKNGWTARYRVSSYLAAPKNDFPTRLVYERTKGPTLRLITCDGQFDTSTGHYFDNYIVFARFDGLHRPN